jgi:hypothetical protein
MKRGNFIVVCDEPGCDNSADLGTSDFNEALQEKDELEGWVTTKIGGGSRGFEDWCPAHRPYGFR